MQGLLLSLQEANTTKLSSWQTLSLLMILHCWLTIDAIDAHNLLQTVEEIAASVGLKMDESKIKYMTEDNIEGNITGLNGDNIEKVEDFVYLGSKIRASKSDIDARQKHGQPAIRLDSLQP